MNNLDTSTISQAFASFIAGMLIENKFPVQASFSDSRFLPFPCPLDYLQLSFHFHHFLDSDWVPGIAIQIAFFSLGRNLSSCSPGHTD